MGRCLFLVIATVVACADLARGDLVFASVTRTQFEHVNYTTGQVKTIAPLPGLANSLSTGPNGKLFAVLEQDDANVLFEIDSRTGEATAVTQLNMGSVGGLAYDANQERLLITGVTNGGGSWVLNEFLFETERLRLVQGLPLGIGQGLAFDPSDDSLIATEILGATSIRFHRIDSFGIQTELFDLPRPRLGQTVEILPDGRVFSANTRMAEIDLATGEAFGGIQLGIDIRGIALIPEPRSAILVACCVVFGWRREVS